MREQDPQEQCNVRALCHRRLALVLRQALQLTLPGLIVGTAVAALATHQLSHGLELPLMRLDPEVFAAAALALLFTVVLATCIPAGRAARVDPMRALRAD